MQASRSTHVCKTGYCTLCNRDFKAIKHHKCPVHRICTVSPLELWKTIKDNGPTCDGCGIQHFRSKQVHGFQRYNNVDLCTDCYDIPQIKRAASRNLELLKMLDIERGKTVCAICTTTLIDPHTGYEVAAFRREYVDVLDKQCTLWAFLKTGATWDYIRLASEQCHSVCVRCHTAISISKRCTGIHRLKTLQLPPFVRRCRKG